jgi:hypothetical protein
MKRFLTRTFWRDLFSIKYWRHRKVVVARTNELLKMTSGKVHLKGINRSVDAPFTWTQARAIAWFEEGYKEYLEGPEGWG